jgi:hypothetical protein
VSDFLTNRDTSGNNQPDLDAYLMDLLYGTRTSALPVNVGPISGYFSEERPGFTSNPIGMPEAPPVRRGDIGVGGELAPGLGGRINAQMQQDQPGAPLQVTPGAQVNLGPLFLRGGLNGLAMNLPEGQAPEYLRPTVGAGMKVPLGGGDASIGFNVDPGRMKGIDAAWRRQFDSGDLGLQLSYQQPTEGRPDLRAIFGGKLRF